MDLYSGLSFLLSIILSYITLPMVINMMVRGNIVCENFKSKEIPSSMGIIFVLGQVVVFGVLQIFFQYLDEFSMVYILGFVFMGFIGLIDDLIGEKTIKGLKGHIKAFLKGTLTTGGIKAFLGFFIALVISSYISNSIFEFIVNSLLIGLFTNFINLFDLRPGRASKMFLILSLIFLLTNIKSKNNFILFSLIGIMIPYISLDLKAKIMMGDIGSNPLGFTLGSYAANNFNLTTKIMILLLMIITHGLAEKISFSKIISENKLLNYIDNIGR